MIDKHIFDFLLETVLNILKLIIPTYIRPSDLFYFPESLFLCHLLQKIGDSSNEEPQAMDSVQYGQVLFLHFTSYPGPSAVIPIMFYMLSKLRLA